MVSPCSGSESCSSCYELCRSRDATGKWHIATRKCMKLMLWPGVSCSSLLPRDGSIGRVYRLVLAVVPTVDDLKQVLAISCPSIRCIYRMCWLLLRFLIRYHRMTFKCLLRCCLLFLPCLCLCLLCCCLLCFRSSILSRPPFSGFRARKDDQLFYARSVYTGFVCS